MIEYDFEGYKGKSVQLASILPSKLEEIWKTSMDNFDEFSQKNLARIFSLTKISDVHLTVALIYAKKIISSLSDKTPLPSGDYFKYFLGCLLLSSKFLDDITFKNKSWSFVSGIPLDEVNKIEQVILRMLDYSLFVVKDDIVEKPVPSLESLCISKKAFKKRFWSENLFSLEL